jgi:hypothetical protein
MIDLDMLRQALVATSGERLAASETLDRLVGLGLDRLPMPGGGQTLQRWQALAIVSEHDLSLAKLYEGHTDALAIWHECTGRAPDVAGTWGVWAAEAPPDRVRIGAASNDGSVELTGVKRWCSGAASARHALLTAWVAESTRPQLVHLDLRQPAVGVDDRAWKALGMAGSPGLDVRMEGAQARLVGEPGAYLDRPGFWHGGAGIAACWFGGALAIANALRRAATTSTTPPDPLRLAALGRVDLQLRATAALLREAAAEIDAHPQADARATSLRARLAAEACAARTLEEVGRALGAAPFCRDDTFARMAVDLPVFIRQSHGDRDLAALGSTLTEPDCQSWAL